MANEAQEIHQYQEIQHVEFRSEYQHRTTLLCHKLHQYLLTGSKLILHQTNSDPFSHQPMSYLPSGISGFQPSVYNQAQYFH